MLLGPLMLLCRTMPRPVPVQVVLRAALLTCITSFCFAQRPSITGFSPGYGAVGTIVTVNGTNLSNVASVTVGGSSALLLSKSSTQVRFAVLTVSPGVQPIVVTNTNALEKDTASSSFSVVPDPRPTELESNTRLIDAAAVRAQQGESVALSADGNTALVGGSRDNTNNGSVWVYIRSGCLWHFQQKLLGPVADARFGRAVALSADGNTAAVSGTDADNGLGAIWVYRRAGTTWQAPVKLSPPDPSTNSPLLTRAGNSVAISGDGTVIAVGAARESRNSVANSGAVWVFRYDGANWSPVSNSANPGTFRRQPTDAIGASQFGSSVSLSLDGSTLAIGGPLDNSGDGKVWVYAWNTAVGDFILQRTLTSGENSVVERAFGTSVSLSSRGGFLAVGAPITDLQVGEVYFFTRSTGSTPTWDATPSKIRPTDRTRPSLFGSSVSISGDGQQLVIGGPALNTEPAEIDGAAWIYVRSGDIWSSAKRLELTALNGATNALFADIGSAIAQSADGTTALVGGPRTGTNSQDQRGAAWAFSLPKPSVNLFNTTTPPQALALTPVNINGTNFQNIQNVTVGGLPAAFTTTSYTSIRAIVPIGAAGPSKIAVYTVCGDSSIVPNGFTALLQPRIDSIRPTSGGPGTIVTIYGRNLFNAAAITFGGYKSLGATVNTLGTQVTTRIANGGSGDVRVTTPFGEVSLSSAYTYLQPPFITFINPPRGDRGAPINVTGVNFIAGQTNVSFGGVSADSVKVTNTTSLVAYPGNGATGSVVVTTPAGSDTLVGAYTQLAPFPKITGYVPSSAKAGDVLRIIGTNMDLVSEVIIGNASATIIGFVGNTEILVTVPVTSRDTVCVTNPRGTICKDGFNVLQPPSISSFAPTSGFTGDSLSISGAHLLGTTSVSIGGTSVLSIDRRTENLVVVKVGEGNVGPISLTTSNGTTISSIGFAYSNVSPAANGVSPSSATALQRVLISGVNLGLTQSVEFGTAGLGFISAPAFRILSSSQVEARVPASAVLGLQEVRVSARFPGSGTVVATTVSFTVTESAPVITSVSTADIGSGSTVLVRGNNLGSLTSATFGFSATPVAATAIIPISDDSVRITVGAGATGLLQVCNNTGCAVSSGPLTFRASPLFTAITPSSAAEGATVTINGNNFFSVSQAKVYLGGKPVRSVTPISTTSFSVVVDTGSSGTVRIELPNGTVESAAGEFNYVFGPPTISSFTPNVGTPGTWVTVSGTRFQNISSIRFNGIPVPINQSTVQIFSTSQLRVRVPSNGSTGKISITNSTATATSASDFFFSLPTPSISRITPDSGFVGERIRIQGNSLYRATQVSLILPTIFSIIDSSTIDAVVPSYPLPSLPISAFIPGVGTITATSQFRYRSAPSITSYSTTVIFPFVPFKIFGSGFTNVKNVSMGPVPTSIAIVSPNEITVTPGLPATRGALSTGYEARVQTDLSLSAFPVLVNYNFPLPTITNVSPLQLKPGDTFTITGTGLYPPESIRIAGLEATDITTNSDFTQLTAKVGPIIGQGNITGPAIVQIVGAVATSTQQATVLRPPSIATTEPSVLKLNSTLVVRGRNFDQITLLRFGGIDVPVSRFVVTGDSIITINPINELFPVGKQALTVGNIAGNALDSVLFIPSPVITSVAPNDLIAGDSTIITGTNLQFAKSPSCTDCEISVQDISVPGFSVINNENVTIQIPPSVVSGASDIRIRTPGGEYTLNSLLRIRSFKVSETEDLTKQIKLRPVPVVDKLQLIGTIVRTSEVVNVRVFNIYGTSVFSQQLPAPINSENFDQTVDLSRLAAGTYFVVVTIGRATGRWPIRKF